MSRDRAAYMRDYRARKRPIDDPAYLRSDIEDWRRQVIKKEGRIIELEAEVAQLKRELAGRPIAGPSFNSRPFTPAPKKGK